MNKTDEQKYTTVPGKFHIQDCHFSSQMLLIRFNFQNNHGNTNSGKNRTRFFKSGTQYRNDIIFRGSHQSCSIEKGFLKTFAKFTGKHLRQCVFFNKVRSATLLKKRLRRRCFPVNLTKFLRRPVLQNTDRRLFLYFIERRKNILFTLSWKEQNFYDIMLCSY